MDVVVVGERGRVTFESRRSGCYKRSVENKREGDAVCVVACCEVDVTVRV